MTDVTSKDLRHRDTLAVHTAVPRSQYGENAEALYLTSGYVQPDAETAGRRFAGEEDGYTYSRLGNPTVTSMELRLAALEGTEAAIATATGMSAILLMCMGLLKSGDHVVLSHSMFGSTIKLIGSEFGKFGVQSSFVSQTDVAQWKAAIRPSTRLLFAETPTNPLTDVCDIRALADIAHNAGALLAVDNCFCTPALQRPVELGADLIVHSGTKYLDGQGRVMAGALCGTQKTVTEVLLPVLRSAGMTLSPFNAWVVLKGLETLDLRAMRQSENAMKVGKFLEGRVPVMLHPGLPSHPQHNLAAAQMKACGPIFSFVLDGGRRQSMDLLNALELVDISNNIGDSRSLATHPASTTHHSVGPEAREAMGVGEGMIRINIGLEDPLDVIDDLDRALTKVGL